MELGAERSSFSISKKNSTVLFIDFDIKIYRKLKIINFKLPILFK